MAIGLLSGAGRILLDEPTYQLDLTSIRVMEQALAHFPGAVFVVSHDRFFIEKNSQSEVGFRGGCYAREVYGNWTTWQAGGIEPLGVQEIYCSIEIDCLA